MKEYKRKCRELSDEHKEKISHAIEGRSKSQAHRQLISLAMKDYWRGVPHRAEEEHLSMDDYLGKPQGK